MSLVRFALRTAAVEAIKAAGTLVGENVRDSEIGTIRAEADGSLRTEEDQPFVLVYTDDGDATDLDLRALHQNGSVDLVFEIGVMATSQERNDLGEVVAESIIPSTDAGYEMGLDIIDREIASALAGEGPWAEIWKKLIDGVPRVQRRRAVGENGVRFAARQITMTLRAKPDPVPGSPLADTSVWRRFQDTVDAERPEISDVVASMLGASADAVTMAQLRERFGHTRAEARVLGYGPFHAGEDDLTITDPQVDGDPA